MISPESWDGNKVSKHHYATYLSKLGNRVYFLNPESGRSFKKVDENIFSLAYRSHFPGTRKFPKWLKSRIILSDFLALQRFIKTKIDIIWNFDSSRYFELSQLPKSVLKLCHIVDLNQDFEWKSLATTADVCLCNSGPIINRIQPLNKRTFFVNHGYNSRTDRTELTLPGNNKLKAVYAGNLDIKYLDYDLLIDLISGYPNIDFVFAGNYSHTNPLANLKSPNVHLMGKLNGNELPSLYEKADVLVVTYLADQHEEQLANPHKIMEYLGSGKTVIATKTLEYENNDLIEMSSSREEFFSKFGAVISQLKEYNSEKRMHERRAFALKNSYENQIKLIEQLIA